MVRDELAFIRTHLANERTALAYLRTSLAFLAAGAGLIHFFPSMTTLISGCALITFGVGTLVAGVLRFVLVRKHVNDERRSSVGQASTEDAER